MRKITLNPGEVLEVCFSGETCRVKIENQFSSPEDVSAFQEMTQYEDFLEGLASLYDVENPETIYEQWVRLPEHTTEQLARMLSEAERNERKKNGTRDCSNHAPNP